MIVVGLTGSIAMGKSTVARIFASLGYPVFDADAAVSELYESDYAAIIEAEFPGVVAGGRVNRDALATRVLVDNSAMARLEAIVHPAVEMRRRQFLTDAFDKGRKVAVLDIPLLFEKGWDRSLDLVVVVSASSESQRVRALSRSNMNASKLEQILSRQTPDSDKRRRAHFIIDNNGSTAKTAAQVSGLARAISGLTGNRIGNARNRSRH